MALTDTEDFFRLSVIAMPKRRSIFDFREQRAKQPCLHGYLATAARVKDPVACSGIFDLSNDCIIVQWKTEKSADIINSSKTQSLFQKGEKSYEKKSN